VIETETGPETGIMRRLHPTFEHLESKVVPTTVFILNGNAFAAARPNFITQTAAAQLIREGDQSVEITTPAIVSPHVFDQLANEIRNLSGDQPIGLMGFSAGGTLAMRLAGQPGLDVKTVLNYYGPPDLRDWLNDHQGDRYGQYLRSHVHLTSAIIDLLSGQSDSDAYFVNAFGLRDHNVVSSVSTASFSSDFQHGAVFYYNGPHGVTLHACAAAFEAFVSHL
jgi:hypothetical protein